MASLLGDGGLVGPGPVDSLARGRGRPPGVRNGEGAIGLYAVRQEGDQSDTVALRYDALASRVAHWMFTNPGKPLTHCARELGVSSQYLYYFVSSDTFKAKYAELAGGEFREALTASFAEKLNAASKLAIDRLTEQLELSPSAEFVMDASEVLIKAAVNMERPKHGGVAVQVNNNFPAIPADVLNAVQVKMLTSATPQVSLPAGDAPGSVIDAGDGAGLPTAE